MKLNVGLPHDQPPNEGWGVGREGGGSKVMARLVAHRGHRAASIIL